MNKNILALIVLIIAGIATYYLVFNNNIKIIPTDTHNDNPIDISQNQNKFQTQTQNENDVTVNINNLSFDPVILTIKPGTKVTWINNDSTPHTITSDSDNVLKSSTISPGQSFYFTFAGAGEANYHCSIHPKMKGKIIVQ